VSFSQNQLSHFLIDSIRSIDRGVDLDRIRFLPSLRTFDDWCATFVESCRLNGRARCRRLSFL
jgi:hypothetical protein